MIFFGDSYGGTRDWVALSFQWTGWRRQDAGPQQMVVWLSEEQLELQENNGKILIWRQFAISMTAHAFKFRISGRDCGKKRTLGVIWRLTRIVNARQVKEHTKLSRVISPRTCPARDVEGCLHCCLNITISLWWRWSTMEHWALKVTFYVEHLCYRDWIL